MPLRLSEPSESDLDQIIPLMFLAFADPPEPYIDVLYPANDTPAGRASAIAQTLKAWRAEKAATRWLKVTDTTTGEIIAAGKWNVFDRGHPYAEKVAARREDGGLEDDERFVADWYDALGMGDEDREHAESVLGYITNKRMRRAQGPHCLLDILFTHPHHHRRGAGTLIMNWGIQRADVLGIEAILESTLAGQHLYETHGFQALENVIVPVPNRFAGRVPVKYTFMKREARAKGEGDLKAEQSERTVEGIMS